MARGIRFLIIVLSPIFDRISSCLIAAVAPGQPPLHAIRPVSDKTHYVEFDIVRLCLRPHYKPELCRCIWLLAHSYFIAVDGRYRMQLI